MEAKRKRVLVPIACSIGCLGLGLLSGLFTIDEITNWYATLEKPSWNPPNWLFGPVWSVLYAMMGVALGLVINSNSAEKKRAITLFVLQFCLNMAWSFIFFNLHRPDIALIEIGVMLILIVLTMRSFGKINRTALFLLVPYVLWVSFATCLNAAIWHLNS